MPPLLNRKFTNPIQHAPILNLICSSINKYCYYCAVARSLPLLQSEYPRSELIQNAHYKVPK